MDINDLYPFATQDGKAIPLDIIKPAFLYMCNVASTVVVPTKYQVVAIHAINVDALVRFGEDLVIPLTSGVYYENTVYIPKNGVVMVALPDNTLHIYPSNTGIVYVQGMEKWAGLGLQKQLERK